MERKVIRETGSVFFPIFSLGVLRKVMWMVCLACRGGDLNNELNDPGGEKQWSDSR